MKGRDSSAEFGDQEMIDTKSASAAPASSAGSSIPGAGAVIVELGGAANRAASRINPENAAPTALGAELTCVPPGTEPIPLPKTIVVDIKRGRAAFSLQFAVTLIEVGAIVSGYILHCIEYYKYRTSLNTEVDFSQIDWTQTPSDFTHLVDESFDQTFNRKLSDLIVHSAVMLFIMYNTISVIGNAIGSLIYRNHKTNLSHAALDATTAHVTKGIPVNLTVRGKKMIAQELEKRGFTVDTTTGLPNQESHHPDHSRMMLKYSFELSQTSKPSEYYKVLASAVRCKPRDNILLNGVVLGAYIYSAVGTSMEEYIGLIRGGYSKLDDLSRGKFFSSLIHSIARVGGTVLNLRNAGSDNREVIGRNLTDEAFSEYLKNHNPKTRNILKRFLKRIGIEEIKDMEGRTVMIQSLEGVEKSVVLAHHLPEATAQAVRASAARIDARVSSSDDSEAAPVVLHDTDHASHIIVAGDSLQSPVAHDSTVEVSEHEKGSLLSGASPPPVTSPADLSGSRSFITGQSPRPNQLPRQQVTGLGSGLFREDPSTSPHLTGLKQKSDNIRRRPQIESGKRS